MDELESWGEHDRSERERERENRLSCTEQRLSQKHCKVIFLMVVVKGCRSLIYRAQTGMDY